MPCPAGMDDPRGRSGVEGDRLDMAGLRAGAGHLRRWASRLKRESYALYLAIKDPRTPWYAKAIGACVVGYALSPIDLIPDLIPILGYLDDLLLVPAGLALARRMIPAAVMAGDALAGPRRNWRRSGRVTWRRGYCRGNLDRAPGAGRRAGVENSSRRPLATKTQAKTSKGPYSRSQKQALPWPE